jgi:glyoxylase-like metal-dependent hydrolase (beta-lactamase superfamily II)
VDVLDVAPGLWRWTGYHEEWKEDVGCLYLEAPDAIVLIDPLVPPEAAGRFLEALDRDVERTGLPVHVLVTIFWHSRSAGELARRYGGGLWAPTRGRAAIARRTGDVTETFRPGDVLPGGIEAYPSGRGTEVVFWLPRHRAIVAGDVLLGDLEGGLRLCPESWLPRGVRHDAVRAALQPLLELPVERVLVSHGVPILTGGREALRGAVLPTGS